MPAVTAASGGRRGRGGRPWSRSTHRWLCGALAAALAGCTGLFHRALPDRVATWEQTAVGGELRVGAAERDVTPQVGGYLAGFDLARTSTGVASPLKVRALVLVLGQRRLALVGIDNLGVMREDADWIKGGIEGFANGDVFLCASHTHAGPDLIGLWGFYLWSSGRDPDYLRQLSRATAEAVAEALAVAAPAQLTRGTGRIPAHGYVKNANRAGCFDRRLVVVHARALDDGRPLGTLLHLACHPEVMPRGNTEICADFVGSLCDGWREAGLGQAVFVNGALGAMVSPAFPERNADGVRQMGADLVAIARAALAAGEPLPVDAIEVRRRDVYLPLTSMGLKLGRLTAVIPRDLYGGYVRSTVGWLRIGGLRAIAVPGEMEPALAQRIRGRLGAPDLLVFGLCDDELGYLMREQDARDPLFAYERGMSPCVRAGEMIEAALCGPAR